MSKQKQIEDIHIDLTEAARLSGYSKGYIRNLVFAGHISRRSRRSTKTLPNGKSKRGPKILVSKAEILEKLGNRNEEKSA